MESIKSVNALSQSNKAQPKLTHRVVDGIKGTKNAPETKANCLSKIAELTEEYDLQGKTIRDQVRIQITNNESMKNQRNDDQNRNEWNMATKVLSKILHKSMNCLALTYQKIYNQIASQDINVAESQISEMLTKLRRKKERRICLLPESVNENRKTLVLDLDQTLVNVYLRKPAFYDHQLEVLVKGTKVSMYIVKRFGLQSFLYEMSQNYEVVVFSSLKWQLVEQIVKLIDPKKYISHLLSREHCVVINQSYFIKPVRDLGRNPKKVIFVDSQSISASLNPENLYKIDRFKGSQKDRKLLKLGYFLKHILELNQIVPVEMHRKQFETKQIQIYDKQNIQKYGHKKKNSQTESVLSLKSGESSVQNFVK